MEKAIQINFTLLKIDLVSHPAFCEDVGWVGVCVCVCVCFLLYVSYLLILFQNGDLIRGDLIIQFVLFLI